MGPPRAVTLVYTQYENEMYTKFTKFGQIVYNAPRGVPIHPSRGELRANYGTKFGKRAAETLYTTPPNLLDLASLLATGAFLPLKTSQITALARQSEAQRHTTPHTAQTAAFGVIQVLGGRGGYLKKSSSRPTGINAGFLQSTSAWEAITSGTNDPFRRGTVGVLL